MIAKKDGAVIVKDISWLWRTAYNCAIDVSSEWSSEVVVGLFDISKEVECAVSLTIFRILNPVQFLELFRKAAVDDNDPVVYAHILFASFSSISARGKN